MRRIKNSLSAKVFLWVFCALMLCSLMIYTVVFITIPQKYTSLVNTQTSSNIEKLTVSLEETGLEQAKELIYNFCIENRTCAMMQVGGETLVFGDRDDFSDSGNSLTFSSTVSLSGQNDLCVLTVIASASAADDVKSTLFTLIPAVLGLIICISGFCAWLCGRSIVRPVLDICSVSKRMAQLDMTWRCNEGRSDELGVLAESLNSLSERLSLAMKELETANNQLKLDVEASKAMEKQRRDFFAAASHELKTPVTILKGQLESMELGIGDYKNHEKYLPEAISAVESIESLIGEILTISRMETGISPDAYTDEMLSEMVNGCVTGITALADEKHMKINIAESENVILCVYQPLFKKAITNILLNAVRYSPAGEKISIEWTKATLTVFNGGVQIPDEDIPLLFTPFYRAEKSRNRKSGGSGLGLYIVKTILDLHGFDCTVENINDGVRFNITFTTTDD